MLKKIAVLNIIIFFSITTYCFAFLGFDYKNLDFKGERPKDVLRKKDGGFERPIITTDGAPVYKSSDTLKEIGKAEFLSPHFVGKKTGDTDDDFSLLIKEVDDDDKPVTFLGWVQNKHLLKSNVAIKTELNIYKKVLIINRWEETTEETNLNAAILHKGPGTTYTESKKANIFKLLYLFKENVIDGKKWYLVGPLPTFGHYKESSLEAAIIGWVPESKVFLWDTREAVQYNKKSLQVAENPRTEPARIYESYEELHRVELGEEISPLSEEDLSVENENRYNEWKHYLLRYPLLESEPFPRKYKITDKVLKELKDLKIETTLLEQDLLDEVFYDKDKFLSEVKSRIKNYTLLEKEEALRREKQILKNSEFGDFKALKIGYIGDQIFISNVIGEGEGYITDDAISAEVAAGYANVADEYAHQSKTLDILFVIDATGSMSPYFDATCSGIEQVVHDIKSTFELRQLNPTLRFSVLFYRDYKDDYDDTSFLTRRKELRSNNNEQIIDYIKEMTADKGGDVPEAVFYALSEQLIQSDLKEGSFRVLIHIGDVGNHEKDEHGYTAEMVNNLLEETHIDLVVGINVSGNPTLKKNMQDYTLGISDEEKLIFTSKSVKDVTEIIVDNIINTVTAAVSTVALTVDAIDGYTVAYLADKYGNRLTDRFVKRMEEEGVDPRWYTEKKVQIFDQGWLLEREKTTGQHFTETMILFSRNDLEKTISFLNSLISVPIEPPTVKEVWKKQLELEIGEAIEPKEKVSEYMTRVLGVPIRHNLLKYSLDDLTGLSSKQLEDLTTELTNKRNSLRSVSRDKISKINEDGKHVEVGSAKRFWGKGISDEATLDFIWLNKNELP
jgi:hypothetical protein